MSWEKGKSLPPSLYEPLCPWFMGLLCPYSYKCSLDLVFAGSCGHSAPVLWAWCCSQIHVGLGKCV